MTSKIYDRGQTMDPLTLADLIEGADLSSLTDHGDTVPLVPGYDVRLVVEYDEDCSIDDEDPEVIGRLQWERSDQRPNGFDGAARILERHWRDGRLWWQPPTDLVKGRDGAAADRIETNGALDQGSTRIGLALGSPRANRPGPGPRRRLALSGLPRTPTDHHGGRRRGSRQRRGRIPSPPDPGAAVRARALREADTQQPTPDHLSQPNPPEATAPGIRP